MGTCVGWFRRVALMGIALQYTFEGTPWTARGDSLMVQDAMLLGTHLGLESQFSFKGKRSSGGPKSPDPNIPTASPDQESSAGSGGSGGEEGSKKKKKFLLRSPFKRKKKLNVADIDFGDASSGQDGQERINSYLPNVRSKEQKSEDTSADKTSEAHTSSEAEKTFPKKQRRSFLPKLSIRHRELKESEADNGSDVASGQDKDGKPSKPSKKLSLFSRTFGHKEKTKPNNTTGADPVSDDELVRNEQPQDKSTSSSSAVPRDQDSDSNLSEISEGPQQEAADTTTPSKRRKKSILGSLRRKMSKGAARGRAADGSSIEQTHAEDASDTEEATERGRSAERSSGKKRKSLLQRLRLSKNSKSSGQGKKKIGKKGPSLLLRQPKLLSGASDDPEDGFPVILRLPQHKEKEPPSHLLVGCMPVQVTNGYTEFSDMFSETGAGCLGRMESERQNEQDGTLV